MDEKRIEELKDIYSISESEYKEYLNDVFTTITTDREKSKEKKLIIVGGQPGAGKSRLSGLAVKESIENTTREDGSIKKRKTGVVVDFDYLRAAHPYYKEVNEQYPEIAHRILHSDTERVKNDVLDMLIKDEYTVIYEGALRHTQGFVDFAKKFKNAGYKIDFKVLATCRLESYGSALYRYADALNTNTEARWVEKVAHDSSYDGVLRTVEEFERLNLADEYNVYVRNDDFPKLIFSSVNDKNKTAVRAIEQGREMGRRKALMGFERKYNIVKTTLVEKRPELIPRLSDWKELYLEESNLLFGRTPGDE